MSARLRIQRAVAYEASSLSPCTFSPRALCAVPRRFSTPLRLVFRSRSTDR